jgi:hypothetical protein
LVNEHIEAIASGLVGEAAASDDVTDKSSASSYLEDRLETLGDLFTTEQAAKVRALFAERSATW